MLTQELNVTMDAEGFMTDPKEWTPEIAEAFAVDEGISPLSETHWKVINWVRAEAAKTGEFPSMRIGKHSGADTKESYELFPEGSVRKSPAAPATRSPRAAPSGLLFCFGGASVAKTSI